ncbi:MAG: polyamine ABC transporter substrate-binding protein, partial [Symploca sp. SIO1A3]|nr:polyamine ABC transporter substrate-binding protein [Symploca sp. SIO1A3]
ILTNVTAQKLPKTLADNSLRLPDAAILKKSEFLNPLSESTHKQYQNLWRKMRQKKD